MRETREKEQQTLTTTRRQQLENATQGIKTQTPATSVAPSSATAPTLATAAKIGASASAAQKLKMQDAKAKRQGDVLTTLFTDVSAVGTGAAAEKAAIQVGLLATICAGGAMSILDIGSDFFDVAVGRAIGGIWTRLLDRVLMKDVDNRLKKWFRYDALPLRQSLALYQRGVMSEEEFKVAARDGELDDAAVAQALVLAKCQRCEYLLGKLMDDYRDGTLDAVTLKTALVNTGAPDKFIQEQLSLVLPTRIRAEAAKLLTSVRTAFSKGYTSEADLRKVCQAAGYSPDEVEIVVATEKSEANIRDLDETVATLKRSYTYDQLNETQLAKALSGSGVEKWRADNIVSYAVAGKKPKVS